MKSLCTLSMALVTLVGSLKACIIWQGILLRVDFVRTILTVILRCLVFQQASCFLILSNIN